MKHPRRLATLLCVPVALLAACGSVGDEDASDGDQDAAVETSVEAEAQGVPAAMATSWREPTTAGERATFDGGAGPAGVWDARRERSSATSASATTRTDPDAPTNALTNAPTSAAAVPTALDPDDAPGHAVEPLAEDPAQTSAGFSESGRWATFVDAEGARATLVDTQTGAVLVLGDALDTTETAASGAHLVSAETGLGTITSTVPRFGPQERWLVGHGARRDRITVRALPGGEVRFTLRGEYSEASFRADGAYLAFGDEHAAHVLALAGMEHVAVRVAGRVDAVRWQRSGLLSFVEHPSEGAPRLHVVRAESPGEHWTLTGVSLEGGAFAMSPDGTYVAAHLGDDATGIYRRGLAEPVLRLAASNELVWDDTGTRLAWTAARDSDDAAEGADTDTATHAVIHVTDVVHGTDVRFEGAGDCPIAPETITSLAGNELVTDTTCNPGCPSIAYQAEGRVYDARTGAPRGTRNGPVELPANAAVDAAEELLSAVPGRTRDDASGAVVFADQTRALMAHGGRGIALVDARHRRVIRRLAGSTGLGLEALRVSPDGARVAAVDAAGRARIWDVATGALRYDAQLSR